MTVISALVLVICVWGVLHTYVVYPRQMLLWARTQDAKNGLTDEQRKLAAAKPTQPTEAYPPVFVLMAAHNEEVVLEVKLNSLFTQDYPGQLTFLVGSDNSLDATNDILTHWAAKDDRLRPTLFTSRQGKPGIINQLAASVNVPEAIFLMTDASVILQPATVRLLVEPLMQDPKLGLVDATMRQTGARPEGIGEAEVNYIDREVLLKQAEGQRWKAMIGPFGGCFAIRAAAFTPVPDRFLVDDFFLCMGAYEKGFGGDSSKVAVVEEAVGQSISAEFRRKVRISSGNWQNLVRFRHLWWPFWKSPLAYAFFSHKVLRWWTPFLLLIGLACWVHLAATLTEHNNNWPTVVLVVLLALAGILLLADLVLTPLGVHFRPARYLRYFVAMNLALLVGFYRYLTGIKSNVWQPSERH